MGRLVGVDYFFEPVCLSTDQNDATELRRLRREENEEEYREKQLANAARIQSQFEGRVIRRTLKSVDWMGRPLLDIPPYEAHMVYLDLTEREKTIIQTLTESVGDR